MSVTFTFRGINSATKNLFVKDYKSSILPTKESRLQRLAGRPGAYSYGAETRERYFEFEVVIEASSLEDLETVKEDLAEWLDLPGSLSISSKPNRVWNNAELTGDTDIETLVSIGTGTLRFVAPEPYATDPTTKIQQISPGVSLKRDQSTALNLDFFDQSYTNLYYLPEGAVRLLKGLEDNDGLDKWYLEGFAGGNHSQTTETVQADGDSTLTLAYQVQGGESYGPKLWTTTTDFNDYSTRTNLTATSNRLQLTGLPSYSYRYPMNDFQAEGWTYNGTVSQDSGFVTISSDGSYGSGIRVFDIARKGMTIDFKGAPTGPSGVDCYVSVSDGSSFVDYQIPESGLSSTKTWYRVRIDSSGTLHFYKGTTFIGSKAMSASGISNRVAFGIDPVASGGTFEIDAVHIALSDLGAPTSSTFNTSGEQVSKAINLSTVKKVKSTRITWNWTRRNSTVDPADNDVKVYVSRDGGTNWTQVITQNGSIPNISVGEDLSSVTDFRWKVVVSTKDPGYSPYFDDIEIHVEAEPNTFYSSGTWWYESTSLRNHKITADTKFFWKEEKPAGTDIICEIDISLNDGQTWLGKQPVTNGGKIPHLTPGTDTSQARMRYYFTLTTTDTSQTPKVKRVDYWYWSGFYSSGERVDLPLDLSPVGVNGNPIGNTLINWDAEQVDHLGNVVIASLAQQQTTQMIVESRTVDAESGFILDPLEKDSDGDGVVDGWTKSAADPDVAFSFDATEKAQKITVSNSAGAEYHHIRRSVSVVEGRTYSLAADLKLVEKAGTTEARAVIAWLNASGSPLQYDFSQSITSAGPDYIQVKAEGKTAPPGAVKAEIRLEISPKAAGDTGTVYFRNAFLHAGATAKAFPAWTQATNGGEIPGLEGALATDPSNLLLNPNMRIDTDGDGIVDQFESNPSSSATETYSFDASEQAQKIEISASADRALVSVDQKVNITGGQTYSLSVDAKVGNVVGTLRGRIYIAWHNASDAVISNTTAAAFTNTSFQRILSEGLAAPPDAVKARVILQAEAQAAGDTGAVWFRNAKLEPSATATPYKSAMELQVRERFTTGNATKSPKMKSLYYEVNESRDTTVVYNGTAPSYPKLIVTVNKEILDYLRITHIESGKQIRINQAYSPGDVIEIDMARYRISLNGTFSSSSMRGYDVAVSDWFPLLKGENNFSIYPADAVTIDLEWVERYK